MIKLQGLFFAAISMSVSSAWATAECDPSIDPWQCECAAELANVAGFCEIVDINTLPDFSDPTMIDTSNWIETTWNGNQETWEVFADVSRAPGNGVFLPTNQNGVWDTQRELNDYLSVLLGVPQDGVGELEPFSYHQKGRSVLFNPGTGNVEQSSGRFWWDLISDNEGQIEVDEIINPALDDCDSIAIDEGNISGNEFNFRAINDVCYKSLPDMCFFVPNFPTCNLPVTYARAGAVSYVKSIYDFQYEAQEVGTSTLFECEGNSCQFVGNLERLEDPAMVRFALVTANFRTSNTLNLRDEQLQIQSASRTLNNATMSVVREKTERTYGFDPKYNSNCTLAAASRSLETLKTTLFAQAPVPNDGIPLCAL